MRVQGLAPLCIGEERRTKKKQCRVDKERERGGESERERRETGGEGWEGVRDRERDL